MWCFIFWALGANATAATTLIYHQGESRYSVERSKAELVFRQSPVVYRIRLKPCNMKLTDEFWTEMERQFTNLPMTKKSNSFVEMGGVKRQLASVPILKSANRYFGRLPKIFLDLSLKDHRQCGLQ